jgi:hypothetical protein
MSHRCKCGSDSFIRRWVGVTVTTPCTIDTKGHLVHMDFSEEEQWDGDGSYTEFSCAACERPIKGRLLRDLRTKYQYE